MAYLTTWLVTFSTTAAAIQFERYAQSLTLVPNVTVGGGSWPTEVSWTLSCSDSTQVVGGAPYDQQISVSHGAACQLELRDSYGDGWNGNSWEGFCHSFTLSDGDLSTETFDVTGPFPCPPTPSPPTPAPTTFDTVTVGGGAYPSEVSWTLSCDDGTSADGDAPSVQIISLSPCTSCLLELRDSYGDGWNGNVWAGHGQSFTLPDGLSIATESFTTAGPCPTTLPPPSPSPTPAPSELTTLPPPSPSPTPAPSELTTLPPPSPSPTPEPSESVRATGDPHLANMLGQRFDLHEEGLHTLVRIPLGAERGAALLSVEAEERQMGAACADMYFQSVNLTGRWVRSGGRVFSAGRVAKTESRRWLQFGKVELKVVQGHTKSGIVYLNLFVRHLRSAGYPVGGILGMDDHTAAATPSQRCQRRISLLAIGVPVLSPENASIARADSE